MRTINELLVVMLSRTDLFVSRNNPGGAQGLCNWSRELYYDKIISNEEHNLLANYIENNRPSKYSSLAAFVYSDNRFYWPSGVLSFRVKWLKKHINLTRNL